MKISPVSAMQRGFTLVELAIVLVIIGLIVGGVLVGQDLIKAAQIRSVVTDIEKFNAAVNTFQGKYTGLPGDLLNTKAVQFGFNTAANDAARDGSYGRGDGDGKLCGCDSLATTAQEVGCETILVWNDLSAAKLISFTSTLTTVTAVSQASLNTAQLANGILPKSKLRDSVLYALSSLSCNSTARVNPNNFLLIGPPDTTASGNIVMYNRQTLGVSTLEARSIDSKLDDGMPKTGIIFLVDSGMTDFDEFGGSGCITNTNQYDTTTEVLANETRCAMMVRMGF